MSKILEPLAKCFFYGVESIIDSFTLLFHLLTSGLNNFFGDLGQVVDDFESLYNCIRHHFLSID